MVRRIVTRASSSTTHITRPQRTTISGLRAFSSSAPHHAYLPPPFEPTHSPDLDSLLQTIRQRVLLPRHLKGTTRRLVSNPESSKQLELEDIRAEIGGVEERLIPHDYSKDGVSWHDTFKQVLALTTESNDFSVWPSLLKGYAGASLKLKRPQQEKLMRRMCNTGNIPILLNLLDDTDQWRRPAPPLVITLLPNAIRSQALSSDFVAAAERAKRSTQSSTEIDAATLSKFETGISRGQTVTELCSLHSNLSGALAAALRRALSRSIRLNLALARPKVHDKMLESFYALTAAPKVSESETSTKLISAAHRAVVLDDPILAALPLEMQSRLEALSALPSSGTDKASQSPKPAPSTTAAQYAERLLGTLEWLPINETTVPTSPTKASSDHNILQQRQAIWFQRALAVAASLRAAAQAPTVKADSLIRKSVAEQQTSVDAALNFVASSQTRTSSPAEWVVAPYMLEQYERYVKGLEWGMFGQHTYD